MTGPVAQLENGVTAYQTTDDPGAQNNIYCEYAWCPPDSRCFVYVRHTPEHAPNIYEYVACTFGTWEKRVLCQGLGATMINGKFYFRHRAARDRLELLAVDLMRDTMTAIPIPAPVPGTGYWAITPDERFLMYSVVISFQPQMFGIGMADLHTGDCRIVYQDPYLCNPHLQVEPGAGRLLLVQHNRGCVFSPQGDCLRLVGDEGATLFLLEIPGGRVQPLQVGPPHTAGISGHETWIGATGEVILTLNLQADYDFGKGPILGVRPGRPAREICAPWQMNHIGMEPSGQIFCADTYAPDDIIIGAPRTNRSAVVCAAKTSYKRGAIDTHPHAYITPDCRWVIFTSDRTGRPQVYAAAIPPAMLAGLQAG